jgi:formate hydrogenlyase subunit 6/NADH:ubiquinone oxidoreductase subunit I
MRGEGEAASIPLLDRYLRFAFDHPEAYRVMFELDPTDCTGCKRCDIVCPSGAISVTEKRAAIDRTVGRTFDDFGIEHDLFERWGESGDPELRELK